MIITSKDLSFHYAQKVEFQVYVNGMYTRTSSGETIIESYLSTLKNEHTARAYKRSIYEFFNFMYPNMELHANMLIVDPVHAMAYVQELQKLLDKGDIKTPTFNNKIKGCRQFYDWIIEQTTLNTSSKKTFNINPFRTVKQMAENNTEGSEPLSPEEVLKMLDKPYGDSRHIQERNMLMLEIAVSTGIRGEALLGIKEENIKYVCGSWVIDTKDKFDKDVVRPINNYHDQLMKWYKADLNMRRTENNGTIFNLHEHSANRIVREWAKVCKIDKKITFHSLRTTTACQVYHLFDENLGRTKAVMQHSHIETTDIYIKKENKINHDAEDIVEIMKGANKNFETIVNEMSREEMLDILMNLDMTVKMKIYKERMK